MMNEVVAFGSCCECGTCVLVCPHNVIDYVDGKPKQVAKATAAVRLLRHERGHRLRRLRAGVSRGSASASSTCATRSYPMEPGVHEDVFGRYRRIVAARCKDPRSSRAARTAGWSRRSSAHGLREGLFDGACVSARRSRRCPAAPKPKVVTTVDEAIASASSLVHVLPERPRARRRAEAHGPEAGLLRRRAVPDHAGPEDPARRSRRS